MPRLLEQPGALGLGLAELGRRVTVCGGEQFARFVLRRVDDLVALALALLAVALDLALTVLQLALPACDLGLRALDLRGGGVLGVALERVRKLGCRANEVQRVHAHRMARRVDVGRLPCGLQDAELRLQLQRMAAERVECLANAVGLERAVVGLRQVLEPGQRGER